LPFFRTDQAKKAHPCGKTAKTRTDKQKHLCLLASIIAFVDNCIEETILCYWQAYLPHVKQGEA
jgi:hypothetical protein